MGRVLPKLPKPKILEQDIRGAKYFKLLGSLLNELHEVGTERDKAGHRRVYFDHYGGLLLLYFFTPILTSLRGIQQASELKKVQGIVGCKRASLGSLSEASSVFEAGVLPGVIQELAGAIESLESRQEWQALAGLTAVDGSLLPALPKMAWALWLDEHHRAAKMHIAFEVLPGIPVKVSLTEGTGSERDQLRRMLEAGRLYVLDRGYAEYVLFQDIINAQSSLIGRLRDNAVWTLIEQRELSNEDKAAGIQRDLVVQLGGPQSGKALQQPLRVVEVLTERRDAQGQPETLLLATDRLDLEAHLVALGYRYRWSVGVSSQGHIIQSVKVRPRLKDSGLVAWEAPWRESKTAEPSDNVLEIEYRQSTRLQRTVNVEVASLHATPVAETVDNARRQQGLAEMSLTRPPSPAGYQRRQGVKEDVSTGEARGARRGNPVEEAFPITLSGKWRRRHPGGGSGRTTVDRRAAKRARREGPGPVSTPFVNVRQG